MFYQLPFPFEDRFPVSFPAPGIITPRDFMRLFFCDKAYERDIKTKPRELQQELNKFAGFLGKDGQDPTVVLHPNTIAEYFPENFIPQHWLSDIAIIQDKRRIYQLDALKRDGTRQKIMIKGPKWRCWLSETEGGLSGITGVKVHLKDSKKEFYELVELQENGVAVERPLGYFQHGQEQWVYAEFVDGEHPHKIIRGHQRKLYLEADAILLARLYRAGFMHEGFATPRFDDKVWRNGKVFLIDTDETYRMREETKRYIVENYSYTLKDYLYCKTLSLSEGLEYTAVFLTELGLKTSAEEVVKMTLEKHHCSLSYLQLQ